MTPPQENPFAELGLGPELCGRLAEAGLTAPTPIQRQAVPALLSGRDGVVVAPTGTGKTLAYLLPLLQRLDAARRETQAVILAPTQELAMQIFREAERYGAPLGVRAVALIGGAALSRQLERMKTKPALVVGTPGRVREVASLKKLSLPSVRHVVVDETDRVFSLGGREDVEKLLRQCARDRQTVFVSATRPEAMKEAERLWLADPWESGDRAAGEDAASGLPDTIRHWYFVCDRREKIDLVRRIVRNLRLKPALLFLNDTERIGELSSKLTYEGIAADTLYADTPGKDRGEALRRFRSGRTALLIATDVAARGLDVPGMPLVIQFEPALDADHYVHRAGRTGRMGREGISLTIVTPQEKFIVEKLSKQLRIAMEPKTLYNGRVCSPEEAESARRKQRGRMEEEKRSQTSSTGRHREERSQSSPSGRLQEKSSPDVSGKQTEPADFPPASKVKKAERDRDRKNKGAPRWLKKKRESGPPNDTK